jgi:uncharacterized protein YggE
MTLALPRKTFLLVISAAALALLLAAGDSAPVFAQDGDNDRRGIWVTGTGTATGAPDLAVLNLGVETLADSAAEARTTAAGGIKAIREALTEREIAPEDLQTRHYRIGPRYDYVEVTECVDEEGDSVEPSESGEPSPGTQCTRSHKQVLRGYQVNNQLDVKVRDLDTVGEVIDGVIEAAGDIVRINGINFSIEDSAALEDEARAAAVADMQAKAVSLAELAGVGLGPLVYLTEFEPSAGQYERARAAYAFAAQESLTSIQPGGLDVVVMVQGVFEIEEAEG